MINLQAVSYVRLGTSDLDGATRFATHYLGLEIAHRAKDAVYLKSDQREHTLCYFAGSPADQAAAFEVRDRADLEAAACELERLGHRVRLGSAEEAELRRVRSFIAFEDPSGNKIELVWRPPTAAGAITQSGMPASPGLATSVSAPPTRRAMKLSGPKFATPA